MVSLVCMYKTIIVVVVYRWGVYLHWTRCSHVARLTGAPDEEQLFDESVCPVL